MAKIAEKKKAPAKKAVTAKNSKDAAKKKVATTKATKGTSARKSAAKSAVRPKAAAASKVAAKKATKKTSAKKSAPKKPIPFKRQIREMLLRSKSEILNEVMGKKPGEDGPLNVDVGDIYDVASNERERELSLILGDREILKLSEIDAALDRLKDKSYGLCDECGEPIAEGRLLAMPFTKVCVECKSNEERLDVFARRFHDEGSANVSARLDIPHDEDS
ncbi:MAG: TraR/DksA family transcriptional regulator [Thermodesulfobacteriota bacterium]